MRAGLSSALAGLKTLSSNVKPSATREGEGGRKLPGDQAVGGDSRSRALARSVLSPPPGYGQSGPPRLPVWTCCIVCPEVQRRVAGRPHWALWDI